MTPDIKTDTNIIPESKVSKKQSGTLGFSPRNFAQSLFFSSLTLIAGCGPIPPELQKRIKPNTPLDTFDYSAQLSVPTVNFEHTILSNIPKGKEQEVARDLAKLQSILNFYIETDEQRLGSKELADNYKSTINNIPSNNSGYISKSEETRPIGAPKRFDDSIKYDLGNTDIILDRRIGSISGKPAEDNLTIFLDKERKISSNRIGSLNGGTEIFTLDETMENLKMFRLDPNIVTGFEALSDINDRNGNHSYFQIDVNIYYADGTHIHIRASTTGRYDLNVNSGPSRAYIAP